MVIFCIGVHKMKFQYSRQEAYWQLTSLFQSVNSGLSTKFSHYHQLSEWHGVHLSRSPAADYGFQVSFRFLQKSQNTLFDRVFESANLPRRPKPRSGSSIYFARKLYCKDQSKSAFKKKLDKASGRFLRICFCKYRTLNHPSPPLLAFCISLWFLSQSTFISTKSVHFACSPYICTVISSSLLRLLIRNCFHENISCTVYSTASQRVAILN